MPSEDHYDDSAFTYFAIAFLGIILIPITISYVRTWQKAFSSKYSGICGCLQCRKKAKQLQLESRKPSMFGILKFVIYILIGVLFVYLIHSARSEIGPSEPVAIFDPYEILQLETGASDDQIRRSYRKLSLKHHPDKNPDDPEAADLFIKIGKAYETLTDPAIKERWEKYGNPDGPQAMSVGIALPSWLVDTKNSSFVLAAYVTFLLIVFPTIAICYWSSQKSTAHNQLSNKTMYLFFKMINQSMRFYKLIRIISLSYEYVTQIKLIRADEPVLQKLKTLLPADEKEKDRNRNKKNQYPPHGIKNSMLFFTHFSRLYNVISPSMLVDLHVLLRQAHQMLMGVIELTASRRWLIPTVEAIEIAQMVTQGVWSDSARMGRNTHLLQLPHITEEQLRKFGGRKWKVTTIKSFLDLGEEKRKEFYKEELTNLTDSQVADIERIIGEMPNDVSVALNTEVDEDDADYGITAGAIVTLKLTFSRPSKTFTDPKKEDEPIEAHAPYLPIPKTEIWWAFVADERTNMLWGLKRINALRDGLEVKILFPAPPKPGAYNFTVFLLCDSYVGFDHKIPFKLDVAKAVELKMPQKEDTEGFYSDEEDVEEEFGGDEEESGSDSED